MQILEQEIYRKERGEAGRVVQDALEVRHVFSHAEWHLVRQHAGRHRNMVVGHGRYAPTACCTA